MSRQSQHHTAVRSSHSRCVAVFVACLCLAPAAARAAEGDSPKLEPYGFLRLDYIENDSRMFSVQSGYWVLSEDSLVGKKDDTEASLHPRLTRAGVNLTPYRVSERVTARGQLEIDFQNGGSSESRPAVRMRQGYFAIQVSQWSFLGGQTWDLLSPLYPSVNDDALQWNAGNLGDRRPQARIGWATGGERSSFSIAAAAGMTGAVNNEDLDENSVLDGQDTGVPHVQGRIGYERPMSGRKLQAGVWGHTGRTKSSAPINGQDEFNTWSLGADLSLPLGQKLVLEGEVWDGAMLNDERGGIGQSVNKVTGQEIQSKGGWGQLALRPSSSCEVFVGGSIDDPDDKDLVSRADVESSGGSLIYSDVGRAENWTAFGSVKYRPWSKFRMALEYIYWRTDYAGLESGTCDRFNLNFSLYY
jgi:hypothetical protein